MAQGGKRKGAGRKPALAGTKKIAYTTKLSPRIVVYLRQCDNAAKVINGALQRSKGFRDFTKHNL